MIVIAEGIIIGNGGGGAIDEVTAEPKYVTEGITFYGSEGELEVGAMPEIEDAATGVPPDAEIYIPEGQHSGRGTANVVLGDQTATEAGTREEKTLYIPNGNGGYTLTEGGIITRDTTSVTSTGTKMTIAEGEYGSFGKLLGEVFTFDESYTPSTSSQILNTAGKYLSGTLQINAIPSGGVGALRDLGYRKVYNESTGVITAVNACVINTPGYLDEDVYGDMLRIYDGPTTLYPGDSITIPSLSDGGGWYMPSNITIAAAACTNASNGVTQYNTERSVELGIDFIPNVFTVSFTAMWSHDPQYIHKLVYYNYSGVYWVEIASCFWDGVSDESYERLIYRDSSSIGTLTLSDGQCMYTLPPFNFGYVFPNIGGSSYAVKF